MRTVLVAALLAAQLASGAAYADDTFEAKAQIAQRLHRVESLVWALTAQCDAGDDVQQRQCRRVRDARAKELATATWIVDADADSFDVGPWNAQKKSVAITLDACVRCAGVEVDGKTWFVTGVAPGPGPHFEGGRLRPGALLDNGRAFADDKVAEMWTHAVAKVRVELVVKLAAKPRWSESGKNGIALDVLAYRVYTPCDGTIIASSPPSSPVEADKKACAAAGEQPTSVAEAEAGPRVEQLTAPLIDEAMKPVVDAAWKCYDQFAVTGKAKLKITVTADGGVLKYEQQGDFSYTPTGACIDKAIAKLKFPRSKKAKTTVLFPITLQP
ncbi:MAG TPA: hypothetical protein VFQ65_24925 [Kofleriaceae bacterium]|nr:hypothetical protein [Kofleriaceae bacterium]